MSTDNDRPDGDGPDGDGPLAGRTALVTGGARRIGRHIVLALARAGADVVVHYRHSADDAAETTAAARAIGVEVAMVQGDLADPAVCERLPVDAAAVLRRPDILVNNASVFARGDWSGTTAADWDEMQAVNLRAPFLLSRALAHGLADDARGDIINLNDWRGLRPRADHFAYTQSKAGLHGLTRNLALALAPRVRVNEVALGAVLPPDEPPEDYVHVTRDEIPTGRFPRPEEVTGAVLFLLGNRTVTGQTICVDGGYHLL